MKIIATVETIGTGATAKTETECTDYAEGFQAMQRTLEDGTRLLSVQVER